MRVVRLTAWAFLAVLVAVTVGFLLRLLAPRRSIGGGEVAYQAPAPSDDAEVAVENAVPLIQLR
jgi:hypothetical protein